MFRAIQSARSTSRKGLTSTLALAVALTAGTAIGATGLAQPAHAASKKEKQSKPDYSKGFVEAYKPVDEAFKAVPEGGDYSAIKAQLPTILSAIQTEDDRMVAGQMVLQVANKLNDPALQRQGLELMLASGKVAPEQVGQFQFFVGNLAYQAKDYEAARKALMDSMASGYTDNDPEGLIIESYFQQDQYKPGIDYLLQAIDKRQAAGQEVPASWVLRGLQVAYNNKLADSADSLAEKLVATNPSPKNWLAALQVVREVNPWNDEQILDLSRLMQATGAIQQENDLAEYVEAADPRKLSNEVLAALDAGVSAGVIKADDQRFAEYRRIANERAADDRADAAKVGSQPPASGAAALGTADLLLSVGDNAKAETMYQAAIDKGGIDVNRALTRKGIAQLRQGKVAEAKATFGQVQGERAPLAKLWATYADSKGSASGGA